MYQQIDSNKRRSFLLVAGFIFFVILVGFIFGKISDWGNFGIIYALIFALPSAFIGYYASDKIVLFIAGATKLEKQDNPEIYNLVENLAITAGLPTPEVYIIPDSSPNAFACGRNPENAKIALTTGIIERLNKNELQGVIAHEFAHIKNYDVRLQTLVVIFVGFITILTGVMRRSMWFGGGRRKREGGGQIQIILMVISLLLLILAPIIAKLIQLAISRKREFLADADGALLTRYPQGLARALEKISSDPTPLRAANNATAHMYIVSPLNNLRDESGKVSWLTKLFMTHPPTEERVKALREMAS